MMDAAQSARSTRAVDPMRLTRFADQGWGTRSMTMVRPQSTYNPTTSWDGMAEDPTPFSRLDAPKRVIPWKEEAGRPAAGTVLGREVLAKSSIPVPEAQIIADGDTGRYGGGPGGVPEGRVAAADNSENALTLRVDSFRNYNIKPEHTRAVQVPRPSAGEVEMLTPADRMTMMEYEKQNFAARRMRHKAEMDDKRLVQIMRCRHPDGCTGVDGLSVGVGSKAYAARGAARDKAAAAARRHADGRRERLRRVATCIRDAPWNKGVSSLLSHDPAVKSSTETCFLQRNNRAARVDLDTHVRVFDSSAPLVNQPRAQKLRNEDLGGKPYNPITNAMVSSHHASVPERLNIRQLHPSQQTLERGAQYRSILNKSGL